MSHDEKRAHWVKEGGISLATGVLFGLTNVLVGHPFDTIRTKMQAQKGFENLSMTKSFIDVIKQEGVRGLYRGCLPPLLGSGIYRSLQFSAFETTYSLLDNRFGRQKIPLTNGLETRVIVGGVIAGTFRSIVETPFEYAKTKRQTGKTWKLKDSFTGFRITWLRTVGLASSFFIVFDSCKRNFNNLYRVKTIGPLIVSGSSAVIAFWIIWPLEKLSTIERAKFIIRERGGIGGLYRGIAPGTVRGFLAYGCSMVVMQYAQRKATEFGLRD